MSDKIFRISILALLAVLAIMEAIALARDVVASVDCSRAMEAVTNFEAVMGEEIDGLAENYQRDVYDKSDNIYQQTFRASEYQFLTEHILVLQNRLMLGIQTACK
jgi:hypothetical protein